MKKKPHNFHLYIFENLLNIIIFDDSKIDRNESLLNSMATLHNIFLASLWPMTIYRQLK